MWFLHLFCVRLTVDQDNFLRLTDPSGRSELALFGALSELAREDVPVGRPWKDTASQPLWSSKRRRAYFIEIH
eukprot:s592_g17.t1